MPHRNRSTIVPLLLALTLVVAGCADSESDATSSTSSAPADTSTTTEQPTASESTTTTVSAPEVGGNNTIVVAETNPPNTFDPIKHSNLNNWYVWQLSYEALVEVLPDGTIAPLLATDWSSDDQGLTYTFTLRDGVTFHNGEPLEPDDVVYSFERLLSEGIPYAQSKFATLERVEASDDGTVVFRLSSPDSSFLLNLGDPFSVANAILNREASASADPAVAMVGTGPFRMVTYAPERELVFEAFDDYWRPELPAADRLVIQYMPEQQAQIAALQAGQIDLMFPAPESSLSLANAEGVEVLAAPTAQSFQVNMGSDEPPLDDVRVRRALALAIDRDELVAVALLGQGQPTGPFPVDHPWAVPISEQPYYGRDVDRARALLTEAGFPDGLELGFMWPAGFDAAGDRIGEILQSQFADIGVTLTLEPLETAVWIDRLVTANYDLTWVAPPYFADPRFYIVPRDGRQGPTPPELQALLDQAQSASADELPAIYEMIQMVEADLVYPFTGLVAKDGYLAFNPASVSGVELDFTMSRRLLFEVESLN